MLLTAEDIKWAIINEGVPRSSSNTSGTLNSLINNTIGSQIILAIRDATFTDLSTLIIGEGHVEFHCGNVDYLFIVDDGTNPPVDYY
jgi:hypothetical protein